ncbi:hypothetical protein NL676_015032 [Syzygium grande]|nr:hypothetical protein NL676_015032 [Syzygium grande]
MTMLIDRTIVEEALELDLAMRRYTVAVVRQGLHGRRRRRDRRRWRRAEVEPSGERCGTGDKIWNRRSGSRAIDWDFGLHPGPRAILDFGSVRWDPSADVAPRVDH